MMHKKAADAKEGGKLENEESFELSHEDKPFSMVNKKFLIPALLPSPRRKQMYDVICWFCAGLCLTDTIRIRLRYSSEIFD